MWRKKALWELVLEAANRLSSSGRSTFRLAELVAEVQALDATRPRASIQPVVQGMTANAGAGPPSPCGKVLWRVDHGYYTLLNEPGKSTDAPLGGGEAAARPTVSSSQLRHQIDDLVVNFDDYVELYGSRAPFARAGQLEHHVSTIRQRQTFRNVDLAVADRPFCWSLYQTLQAWGIGRRASRLVPFESFVAELARVAPRLHGIEHLAIERLDTRQRREVALELDQLITELRVVDNIARIVAGTKTLHHLLPRLVPPMDRAWTGAFFGWTTTDPQYRQTSIFIEAFCALAGVAEATVPSRLIGAGWNTSESKILDNAVIGSCIARGIGPS